MSRDYYSAYVRERRGRKKDTLKNRKEQVLLQKDINVSSGCYTDTTFLLPVDVCFSFGICYGLSLCTALNSIWWLVHRCSTTLRSTWAHASPFSWATEILLLLVKDAYLSNAGQQEIFQQRLSASCPKLFNKNLYHTSLSFSRPTLSFFLSSWLEATRRKCCLIY